MTEPSGAAEPKSGRPLKEIPGLDKLAKRHAGGAGESLASLAREAGVKGETLRRHFELAGHLKPGQKLKSGQPRGVDVTSGIPINEVVRLYEDEGMTVIRIVAELKSRNIHTDQRKVTVALDRAGVRRRRGRWYGKPPESK